MSQAKLNVDTLFCEAIAIDDAAARLAFIDQASSGNPQLRQHLEKLVAAHFRAGDFLQQPVAGVATAVPDSAPDLAVTAPAVHEPGCMIGPYKIRESLGEGGMGSVYVAEQERPVRRKVALKVIKPGMDSREVIARFEAERQALTMMDHPHIAKVLDAGTTASSDGRHLGRPYFVMELVKGLTITDHCDTYQLGVSERLELFIQVCRAVQHAHQKAVIHRDLKPSNILVAVHDTTPVVKVIDFGVAKALGSKLTDNTLYTGFNQLVGTPLYMSPEQAGQSSLDIDTRSDIYSLGVLLYELLTGSTPFDSSNLKQAGYDEMRRMIREVDPPRPSARISTLTAVDLSTIAEKRHLEPRRLRRMLRGELDWIVMKALEKDRSRRYESVGALAADIQRYVRNEPVAACRPSLGYRLRKMSRRYWKALSVAGLMLVMMGVAGGLLWIERNETLAALARESSQHQLADKQRRLAEEQGRLAKKQQALAEQQRVAAEEQKAKAYQSLYYADMGMAQRDWEHGQIRRMMAILEKYEPQPGDLDVRGWEWYYLRSLPHRYGLSLGEFHDPQTGVSWSPDGTRVAARSVDGMVTIWDVSAKRMILALPSVVASPGVASHELVPVWSPDGSRLATPGSDGVTVWDTNSVRESAVLRTNAPVSSVAWSPDGKRLAAGTSDKVLRIWDSPFDNEPEELEGHSYGPINAVAWSPDGSQLASGGNDQAIRIWDPQTGRQVQTLDGHFPDLFTLDWSPDGQRLASGGFDGMARIWNVGSGEQVSSLIHRGSVDKVVWNRDGRYLATTGRDLQIHVWDAATFQLVQHLRGHRGGVHGLAWSPREDVLASAGADGEVRLWEVDQVKGAFPTGIRSSHGSKMAFSPDDRLIAYVTPDSSVSVIDISTRRELLKTPAIARTDDGFPSLAWGPDGRRLATLSAQGAAVEVLEVPSGERLSTLSPAGGRPESVSWSWDGNRIASASVFPAYARIWNSASGAELHSIPLGSSSVASVSWSPRKNWLATSSGDGVIRLWDANDCKEHQALIGHRGWVGPLAWSPEGDRLASGGFDRLIRIWELERGQIVLTLSGHTGEINSVAWNRAGDRLASASKDGTMRIWDTKTGQEALIINREGMADVAWSHDGKKILLGTPSSVELLDASWAYESAAGLDDDQAADLPGRQAMRDGPFPTNLSLTAIEIWERLASDHPEIPSHRANLAIFHASLAVLQQANGKSVEAQASIRKAIEIQEKLTAEHGEQTDDQSSLARTSALLHILQDIPQPHEYELTPPDQDVWGRAEVASESNRQAWELARNGEASRAVQLASLATALAPNDASHWNTLGVARYRAHDWESAVEALEYSVKLTMDDFAFNGFFLAMAHWQLGQQAEARQYYEKAVEWIETNRAKHEELTRFRTEAAELLGIKPDTSPANITSPTPAEKAAAANP